MSYYVYEDDETNYVRIHRGECRDCKWGEGKKGYRLDDNRWHGAFPDKASALAKARKTKRPIYECKICVP